MESLMRFHRNRECCSIACSGMRVRSAIQVRDAVVGDSQACRRLLHLRRKVRFEPEFKPARQKSLEYALRGRLSD
jgi:hypothetical protein